MTTPVSMATQDRSLYGGSVDDRALSTPGYPHSKLTVCSAIKSARYDFHITPL